MAKFDFDNTGLAQPSSSTAVSGSHTADKYIVFISEANSSLEVNVDSTNGSGTWINSKGEDLEDEVTIGGWTKMPQDAVMLRVETSSGSHNVNVPTDGGVRTTHRSAAADGKSVYIRDVSGSVADA